ncbi:unnamed protein product [Moneuplotes crassus]|uniref:Uncharacterized protein n=1 Tax=Euplotes crassus TaxID=5936 RepID=A0AAD1XMN4_EUPCR|nr:unnamed protein product [Moneuplotes crassus]
MEKNAGFSCPRVRFGCQESEKSLGDDVSSISSVDDGDSDLPQVMPENYRRNFSQPFFISNTTPRRGAVFRKESKASKSNNTSSTNLNLKDSQQKVCQKVSHKKLFMKPTQKTADLMERCRNDKFRRMLLRYAPELRNLIKQQELDLPEIPLFIQKKKMRSKLTRFSQLKFSYADNDKDFIKIKDICLLGGRLNQPAPKIFSLCKQKYTERLNKILRIDPLSVQNVCCKKLICNTTNKFNEAITHFKSKNRQIVIKNIRNSLG